MCRIIHRSLFISVWSVTYFIPDIGKLCRVCSLHTHTHTHTHTPILVILDRRLWTLLSFSKIRLFVSLVVCIPFSYFLFLLSWFPVCCLLWVYFCYSFSRFLKRKLLLLIRVLYFLLIQTFEAVHLPPSTALATSCTFWYVVFSFWSTSKCFLISPEYRHLPHGLFPCGRRFSS